MKKESRAMAEAARLITSHHHKGKKDEDGDEDYPGRKTKHERYRLHAPPATLHYSY